MTGTRVEGRMAVVTGSASGIGAAAVSHLAGQGWTVHALDRQPGGHDAARAWHTVDVTEADSLRSVADRIGPVDALVTAARGAPSSW